MFTAKQITEITNGTLSGADAEITGISTDTRTIKPGDLFIAINGENFDGNDFVEEAVKKGAAAVISDRKGGVFEGAPVVYVKDSRIAQLKLARSYRERFDLKLVGVTGSVGKTSTKDMIYSALSAQLPTLRTEGNFNNDIGLPKTLFRLDESCKAAVIEMGMSDLGEISVLSNTARPDVCVITNIGYCHIAQLKTQENILKAKLEILDGASKTAPVIVFGDDPLLGGLTEKDVGGRMIVRYGFSENNDVQVEIAERFENSQSFTLRYKGSAYSGTVPVLGDHHLLNAAAAFAVGIELGLDAEKLLEGMKSYEPSGMRQRIEMRGGIKLILDCYNASPTSMKSSLNTLVQIAGEHRRIAVLGDMLELGERSAELHRSLADLADDVDFFFLYGHEMAALRDELIKREFPVFHSENKAEITRELLENVRDGDVVLIKGSRGMKMEEIADRIVG